jgi:hypothetical protein
VKPAAVVPPGRVRVVLDQVRVLKGSVPEARNNNIEVQGWVDEVRPEVHLTRAQLEAARGRGIVAFLDRTGPDNPEPGLHLKDGPAGFAPATAAELERLRTEVVRQAELLRGFSRAPYGRPDSTDERVRALLDGLADPARVDGTVAAILGMGCAAVPALIRNMDDGRVYAARWLSLKNRSPDAFEGIRHYGPKLVVDALAAILNELAGQGFGFIYNGGSSDERDRAVASWRTWLALVGGRPSCP